MVAVSCSPAGGQLDLHGTRLPAWPTSSPSRHSARYSLAAVGLAFGTHIGSRATATSSPDLSFHPTATPTLAPSSTARFPHSRLIPRAGGDVLPRDPRICVCQPRLALRPLCSAGPGPHRGGPWLVTRLLCGLLSHA
ncbi:hypothetical protein ACQJBY_063604 [Aegilops geniculata]